MHNETHYLVETARFDTVSRFNDIGPVLWDFDPLNKLMSLKCL